MSIQLEPLVLAIDRPTTLTIGNLTSHARYGIHIRSRRQHDVAIEREFVAGANGRHTIEGVYGVRGEYMVDIWAVPGEDHGEHRGEYRREHRRDPHLDPRLARLHFNVLPPDLFARRPLRCDFHIHTHYSDGRATPAEMVIRGRELGLDVAVITDHDSYTGSIEAMAEAARLELNLITAPGEEVSGPNWHILSIDADRGIHDLALQERILENDRVWEYDTLCWAIRAVQAHGGRAYLAHPYWAVSRGFHLPPAMYDRILREGILDGVELLGDVVNENNQRSLARYLDYRVTGHDIPILSNSDTHGAVHTYGTYWTLVFAEDPSLEGVLDAIADGWSVACTTAGTKGQDRRTDTRAYGTFELVDYAYFLEQNFFPMHDALCAEEASLAYRAWRGDRLPEGAMAACKAKMEALYARCWGA